MSQAIDNLLVLARHARFDDPDGARRDLVEAVALARKAEDPLQLAKTLTALGQIERDLHRMDEALRHYEEVADIYRSVDIPLKFAHAVRHAGDIHQDEGHLQLAEPCYVEALTIYRAHPETPPLDLANTLRGLALLKEAIGEPKESVALWQEARNLYASVNVEAGVQESERRLKHLG
ncbi:MAG TPA: tetratricopeptide repeat protein [Candidatus Angelobacter sp.]|jgi:tetratricopeptide (TPR) repeat protein